MSLAAEVLVLAEVRRDLTGETARDRGTGEEGIPGGEPSSLPYTRREKTIGLVRSGNCAIEMLEHKNQYYYPA